MNNSPLSAQTPLLHRCALHRTCQGRGKVAAGGRPVTGIPISPYEVQCPVKESSHTRSNALSRRAPIRGPMPCPGEPPYEVQCPVTAGPHTRSGCPVIRALKRGRMPCQGEPPHEARCLVTGHPHTRPDALSPESPHEVGTDLLVRVKVAVCGPWARTRGRAAAVAQRCKALHVTHRSGPNLWRC